MIIIFLCFVIAGYIALFFSRVSICFLSRNKLKECIDTNHEFYIRFSDADLCARHVKTVEEYLDKIKPTISSFTISEKLKILYCISCADYRMRQIHLDWYDGKKASAIQWKIGCIDGHEYEDGMPHTIRDTIILYRDIIDKYTVEELTKTLIHENVHLYQKRFPEQTRLYLKLLNFSVHKKIDETDNVRANPDIDDYIYKDNTIIYMAEYKTTTPSFIEDTKKQDESTEHPFEKMAIDIENLPT
uniref:SprT-like domain-containing protein n=1 Tax=viral metagenome TaxID=1070528 RepID=A0A6C0KI17_9ZZZZ